jgi:S-formylglutathione hydrolase FrmB
MSAPPAPFWHGSSARPTRTATVAASRVVIAAGIVALVRLAGGTQATDDALQVMGFDPDRSRLIVALILGALAATTVSLLGGGRRVASLTGLAAAAVWFGRTFIAETSRVLGTTGATGQFDPGGWALTLISLLAAGVAVGWAAAVLARDVRGALVVAIAAVDPRERIGPRMDPGDADVTPTTRHSGGVRRAAPIARVLLVAAVAVVTLPILGDIFNFDPDIHMQSGGASRMGLVGSDAGGASPAAGVSRHGTAAIPVAGGRVAATTSGPHRSGLPTGSSSSASASASGASGPLANFPADLVAGPVKGSFVTAGAIGPASWGAAPSGAGRTMSVHLPAPWTGGTSSTASLQIYLPPGYDASGARYPVFYEAPSTLGSWQNGMAFTSAMDALMTSGKLPPAIVVFVSEAGGPYPDAECADTYDGKEWFSRFMATDVVNWVDSNLRTIARPEARSTLGFSQGGYCSAADMARHPDVFRTSVSMSGYFQAGVRSGTTPTAWRPFNNDPTLMAAASPLDLVPQLAPSVRSGLMVIMEADPKNAFYGVQAQRYATALDLAGVPIAILPDPRGHSWDAARPDIPGMMRIAAMRMVQLGVFGPTN